MVDAPRFTRSLTRPVDAMGGVTHIVVNHRDDVADARRWAEHYGRRVWIPNLKDCGQERMPFPRILRYRLLHTAGCLVHRSRQVLLRLPEHRP